MKSAGNAVLRIRINSDFLCDAALLLYFCVLFGHQQENMTDMLLRYGSLAFLTGTHFFLCPCFKNAKGNPVFRMGKFELWMIILWLYGAASSFWSIDASNAYGVLWNLLKTMLACFMIRPRLNSRRRIDRVLALLLAALVYMLLLLVVRTPASAWGTERIGEVIGQHSNEIGRLASLGALLSFYFMTRKNKISVSYAIPFMAFIMTGFMTGSKNAILIIIFQLAAYWILISKSWIKIFEIAFVAVGCVFIYWLIMNNQMLYQLVGIRVERMLNLFISGENVDGSTSERLYFIRTAWQLFKAHPVFGIGMNNFSAYLASIGYSNPVYSHCGFLELLSTLGIPGFCVYYSMHFRIAAGLCRPALKRDKMAAVLLALCLRVLLFDVSTISMYTYNMYITLMIAYCFMLKKEEKNGLHAETAAKKEGKRCGDGQCTDSCI
ncbi:O-antigen ligase [Marvinbryantia formatexigens]|nr:O-antigen ligase [Marvinbryantia formatexigens]